MYLGHNDDLIAIEVVLLDRLAQNDLRQPVRVHVGGVERVDTRVVSGFNVRDTLLLTQTPGRRASGQS